MQVATARIYLAPEAQKIGLVDEVGYLKDAVAKAKSMAGLGADAKVVTFRRHEFSEDHIYNPTAQTGTPSAGAGVPSLTRIAGIPQAGFYYVWPAAIGGR